MELKHKRFVLLGITCLLIALFFVWGFVSAEKRIFPFYFLRATAAASGIWTPSGAKAVNVKSRSRAMALLRSLPYVAGTVDTNADAKGVILHDQEKALQGLNFYSSRSESSARLIDMDGNSVYEWAYPSAEWQHAELLPTGELLVVVKDEKIMKLDRHSGRMWSYETPVHHDLWVDLEDRIYILTRRSKVMTAVHPTIPCLDDSITILSSDGERIDEVSLLDLIKSSPYAFLIPIASQRYSDAESTQAGDIVLDPLHANHIEVFDGSQEYISALFAKGNWLVSLRNINTIAIVDGRTRTIQWIWGPSNLTYQHHPTLLANNHLLIFNNGLKASEVLELDPQTSEIVWSYAPGDQFFSETRGSNQRLENGNTLVTESDRGYVFEVTKNAEIVWKFANPDITPDGLRNAIWRMTRYHREDLPFLNSGVGGIED